MIERVRSLVKMGKKLLYMIKVRLIRMVKNPHLIEKNIKKKLILLKKTTLFHIRNNLLKYRPIRVKHKNLSLFFHPEGSLASSAWLLGKVDWYEVDLILSVIQPGMSFLDIDSNAGLYSICVGKKFPSTKVYACEPCDSTFQMLRENIKLNDLKNVQAFRTALGDYNGEATLQINDHNLDGLNTIGVPSHPGCRVIGQEKVPITTIEAFLTEHNISQIDVMKVDAEGAERLIFQGGKDFFSSNKAPLILFECFSFLCEGFGYHPVEILWLLDSFGYHIYKLDKNGAISPRSPSNWYGSMLVAAKNHHINKYSIFQEKI